MGLAGDQLSKLAAVTYLSPGTSIELIEGHLLLTLIRNPGAAFGMGGSFTVVFSVFAVVALLAALVYALPRIRRPAHAVALGLLVAGIAGNLWDRIFLEPGPLRGHVIDFFNVPWFAIFNIADICITVAAVLIVWFSFTGEGEDSEATKETQTA